jgi:AcrR family transcriptional regulator
MDAARPPQKQRRILEKLRYSSTAEGALTEERLEGSPERILDAALGDISDNGLRRFTVDRLAKRVGLSRVTIYRHFPGKEGIVEAVLLREMRAFMTQVGEVVGNYDHLDDRVVEGVVFALTWLREHALLQRLLRNEPELILPLLTTHGSPVVELGRDFITGFARGKPDATPLKLDTEQLNVLGEVLTRMVISFVLTPESTVPVQTEPEIRAFAERYLRPMIAAFTRAAAGS